MNKILTLFGFSTKRYRLFFYWLLCCTLFFTLISLYWQIILLAIFSVILTSCLALFYLSYRRNFRKRSLFLQNSQLDTQGFQLYTNKLISIMHLLLVAILTTGISMMLLTYIYWFLLPPKLLQTKEPSTSFPSITVLNSSFSSGPVAKNVSVPSLLRYQETTPTSYVILARPASINQPPLTYTPVPSQISNTIRESDLLRLLPGVIISHIDRSNNLLPSADDYFILINNSLKIDISGWTLVDENQLLCTFGEAWIEQNSIIKVRRGKGDTTKQHIFCDCDINLWKAERKILLLKDSFGNTVDSWVNLKYTSVTPN